jgi:hypothetical protein
MARTKMTARKSTGRRLPPPPPPGVAWELQEPSRQFMDGLHLPMPKLLWKVLQEQGHKVPPMYIGDCNPLGDEAYTWNVTIVIFKPNQTYQEVLREHQAIAPWRYFEDGVQDAARQALQVACSMNRPHMENTSFVHLPQRRSGTLKLVTEQTEYDDDPRLTTTVDALSTFARRLDAAEDELAYMHERFDKLRKEYIEMQTYLTMDGEDNNEQEMDFNFRPKPKPRSPCRKKLRAEQMFVPINQAIEGDDEEEEDPEEAEGSGSHVDQDE